MSYDLIWSERAIINLQYIEKYIAEDSPSQGKKVVNEIIDYVEELRTFPFIGRCVYELNDYNLRQLIKYSYRIIYTIQKSQIQNHFFMINSSPQTT